MSILPIKKLSLKKWLQIFIIWTLVAVSMSTQLYLNTVLGNPKVMWIIMLLKQLPAWYLCALLTGVILHFYELYPLDNHGWKKNLARQAVAGLMVLLIFSHFRVWAIAYIMDKEIRDFSSRVYLNAYLSQLAWDLAIYVLITLSIFADKTNTSRRQKELLAAEMELRNKELENQLNIAQLEALKLQLSPHFLFNTLNTVNALIRAQENTKAIQVNSMLGDFLRSTLYSRHAPFIPLSEEMHFADLYLGIELLRFSDRLKIRKEISNESLAVQVPHFILLPIIENSIKHGIAKNSNAGLIAIQADVTDNKLKLNIYNEGMLLPDSWRLGACRGIGLKNVSERLAKIYDNESFFSIENHPLGKGVQVSLHIPVA